MGNSFWKTPFKPVPVNKQSSRGIGEVTSTPLITTPDTRSILRKELLNSCELLERKLPRNGPVGKTMDPAILDKQNPIYVNIRKTIKEAFTFKTEYGNEIVHLFVENIRFFGRKRICSMEIYSNFYEILKLFCDEESLKIFFKGQDLKLLKELAEKEFIDQSKTKSISKKKSKKINKREKKKVLTEKVPQSTKSALKHTYFENLQKMLDNVAG